MLNDFIVEVCEILNIEPPKVSFDISHFASDTMMAQCSLDGKTIYIKRFKKINPDVLFSVCHELRHVWQIRNNQQLYFADYKPIDLIGDIEVYNLQIAELDANAFAGLVMIDYFGLTPLFEGLTDSVKNKIFERMEYLKTIL